jgi:hypothetical protein
MTDQETTQTAAPIKRKAPPRSAVGVSHALHAELTKVSAQHDIPAAKVIEVMWTLLNSTPHMKDALNQALTSTAKVYAEKRGLRGPIPGAKGRLLRQLAKEMSMEELNALLARHASGAGDYASIE